MNLHLSSGNSADTCGQTDRWTNHESNNRERFCGDSMTPATTKYTYLGLHTKYPIFLPDCNQIRTSLAGFHKSHKY